MDIGTLAQAAFEHYRSFNEANPITGSILTAGVIFPTADIASQLITDKTVDWRKVRYTAGLVPFYGAWAYLSVRSGDLVGAYVSGHPLAKAALGPNALGPIFNLFFFLNNSVGEKSGYSLRALGRHYRSFFQRERGVKSKREESTTVDALTENAEKIAEKTNERVEKTDEIAGKIVGETQNKKNNTFSTNLHQKLLDYVPRKEYWNSFIGTLTFWNAFQYVNYSYIPHELQTPATLGVAFGWTVLLSLWSLGGRRKMSEGNYRS